MKWERRRKRRLLPQGEDPGGGRGPDRPLVRERDTHTLRDTQELSYNVADVFLHLLSATARKSVKAKKVSVKDKEEEEPRADITPPTDTASVDAPSSLLQVAVTSEVDAQPAASVPDLQEKETKADTPADQPSLEASSAGQERQTDPPESQSLEGKQETVGKTSTDSTTLQGRERRPDGLESIRCVQ